MNKTNQVLQMNNLLSVEFLYVNKPRTSKFYQLFKEKGYEGIFGEFNMSCEKYTYSS